MNIAQIRFYRFIRLTNRISRMWRNSICASFHAEIRPYFSLVHEIDEHRFNGDSK